jgi:hypothetical protein
VFTQSALLDLVKIADATNPGQTTAIDGDITPFIERGGKLIGFVGTADQLIPYGSVCDSYCIPTRTATKVIQSVFLQS